MQLFEFDNRNEFISFIVNKTNNKNSIILGGHYFLIYNNKTNKLEPAILQNNNSAPDEYYKILSGSFPLESLDIALNIYMQKKNRKELAKISILVNDHLFQSKSLKFLIFNEEIREWGSLKEEYYKYSKLPEQFVKIINSYELNADKVFLKNSNYKSRFYHPILLSETSLRKKFDRYLKRKLSSIDAFLLKKHENKKSELFFIDDKKHSFCLTDEGLCGCSGEVMQFLYKIHMLNYSSLVLLVPNDCFDSVCKGVEAFISYIQEKAPLANISSFIIAKGFGENDFIFPKKNEKIRAIHYNTKSISL